MGTPTIESAAVRSGALTGWQHLPNAISLARIVAVIPLYALLASGMRGAFYTGLMVCWLSDFVDGYLARRLHAESELGRKLDSLADNVQLIALGYWVVLLYSDFLWQHAAGTVYLCVCVIVPQASGIWKHGTPLGFHIHSARVAGCLACFWFFWAVVVNPSAFLARTLLVSVTLKTIEELLIIFLVEDPYRDPRNSFLGYRRAGRVDI